MKYWHSNRMNDWHSKRMNDWYSNRMKAWHSNRMNDWHGSRMNDWHSSRMNDLYSNRMKDLYSNRMKDLYSNRMKDLYKQQLSAEPYASTPIHLYEQRELWSVYNHALYYCLKPTLFCKSLWLSVCLSVSERNVILSFFLFFVFLFVFNMRICRGSV